MGPLAFPITQLLFLFSMICLRADLSSSFIPSSRMIHHSSIQHKQNPATTTKLQSTTQPPPRSSPSSNEKSSQSPSNSSRTTTKITPSRVVAANSLIEKNSKKGNNNYNPVAKLESNPQFQNLSQRDKSFARNLVSTTVRYKGQIDTLLNIICDKYPPKCGKHSGIVTSCLRMGAAQILFMNVKDFAAVKETVNVLKDGQFQTPERLIKFVNAILRRIGKEGREILEKETSITDNIIPWLLNEWNQTYGEEVTLKMVEQLLNTVSHQHVDISLNIEHLYCGNNDNEDTQEEEIKAIVREFESAGEDHGSITLLPNKSLRIKKGTETIVSNYPLYNEGRWWVQDVSSTLPAIGLISALNSFYDDFSNVHVVDMCAAPGGKTSQLLAAGFAKVTAIETNARRCRRLKENLNRLGFEDRCEVVVSAGQDWVNEDNDSNVAAVLLDVPCSATGTGNRRPDVLQKDTEDLKSLHEIQGILANHCVESILSKGGIMVYATCSLLKSESEDQVSKLLQRGDVQTLPFTTGEINGFDEAIDENGWLRVLPGVLSGQLNICDGFFVARLIKV